jgi:hypothetical protein
MILNYYFCFLRSAIAVLIGYCSPAFRYKSALMLRLRASTSIRAMLAGFCATINGLSCLSVELSAAPLRIDEKLSSVIPFNLNSINTCPYGSSVDILTQCRHPEPSIRELTEGNLFQCLSSRKDAETSSV